MEQRNGRYQKVTAYIAAGTFFVTFVSAIIYIIWWLFTLSSAQDYQKLKNMEFERRITQNNDGVRDLQLKARQNERDLNEIETQFCASDIVRNLTHAEDMRKLSLLWSKVYGTPFPTDNAYYPMVCNRKSSQ